MKRYLILTTLLAVLSIGYSQKKRNDNQILGNGNNISVEKDVAKYNQIIVNGFFDIELIEGESSKIILHGEENLLPHIKVETKNDILKIVLEKGISIEPSKKNHIKLVVPINKETKSIALNGSGDIYSKTKLDFKDIDFSLTGSGDFDLDLNAESVTANLSGAGDIFLHGSSKNLNLNIQGSGNISSEKCKAENVWANVSGSGNITLWCSEALKARVSGSGNIKYFGNPEKRDLKTTGSGNIGM